MNLQAHNSPRVLDNSIAKQKASSEKAIVQKIAVWKKGRKKTLFSTLYRQDCVWLAD